MNNNIRRPMGPRPVGHPISKYRSVLEVLECLRDAIKAHRSLYLDKNILHQDISISNLIIPNTYIDNQDSPKGVLIHLDSSRDLKILSKEPNGLTGTKLFMAIQLLQSGVESPILHTYRHDLESFFYVFLFLAVAGHGESTDEMNWAEIARKRTEVISSMSNFNELINEFLPEFENCKDLADDLREILFFPDGDDDFFIGTKTDGKEIEKIYGAMINAFEDAVAHEKLLILLSECLKFSAIPRISEGNDLLFSFSSHLINLASAKKVVYAEIMLREVAYSVAGFVLLAYAAEWILSLFDDPREPKRLQSKIPLFGHLWGMMKYSSGYHGITSKQTNEEIYTVAIFNTKLYVAKTSRLIPLIQKTSKTLSFRPFIQTAAKHMGDAKPETFEIFGTEWVDSFSHAHKNGLATGPSLDEQNLRMGDRALIDIAQLLPKEADGVEKVSLLEWAQYAVVQASACGIFGVEHPFLDPKVDAAFWKWQSYLPLHLVNLDITRKGYAAREVVFDAFRKYNKNIPSDVSLVYKERLRSMQEAGIDEDDICKQQATFGTAAFANTVPIMYWTIYELFSRTDLLEEVRKEVIAQAVSGDKATGFKLDVAALKTKCPLTLSVFQETQRLRHVHANIRKVTEDTLLDGKYLLKAGHYVMMPGQPVHTNTSTWGPSADKFDPYRFIKDSSDRKASSFVAWGAPPHLCPARQFATTEILIVIALLAVRSDITPVEGTWAKNPALNTGDMSTIYTPKKSVQVEVRKRDDWDGEWSLKMGESKTRISLASG
ncbi:hypothetical protein FBEOM_14635 [Fusarium beomiforme]|uniref:Protein kinase domain-containing protein n=1 Tax=Fusarium beomiforme TaxID=44412 RepID=A0A9P5A329_9HYPO|nr:hypothetical protein FBEOM_14635 [Fusarium beomiforme]